MKSWFLLACLTSCLAPQLAAQGLRVTAQAGGSVTAVTDGGTVQVPSTGGQSVATFTVSNAGLSSIRIDQVTATDGTASWAIITPLALPATLGPNGNLSFSVRFIPTSTSSSSAPLSIRYTEAAQSKLFTATLVGAAPDFLFSFIDPSGQRTQVTTGARLVFGTTPPGTPRTGSLAILNRGSAAGTLNSALVTGRDFSSAVTGISIPAGQEVTVPIVFNPQARGLANGTIALNLGGLSPTFLLEGTGAGPVFVVSYALRTTGNARPLTEGGRIVFDPTSATTSAIAEVAIANQGNGTGSLRSVSVSGVPFQLLGLPVLPANVDPGQTVRFNVSFNPTQLGSFTGTLRIELDNLTINAGLEGSTSNPEFSFAYIDPATNNVVPLAQDGTLTFPATVVDSSTNFAVLVRNQGVGTGFLNSAAISGAAFQLTDLPTLPLTIAPGTTVRLGVRFTPRTRELQTGSIAFDVGTTVLRVSLAGSGVAGEFSYEAAAPGEDPVRLPPNSELSFSTSTGQTVSKMIRVTNIGNTERQIPAISITGPGFQLANLPFLPVTLPVNGSESFFVTFSPTQADNVRGRLRVGNETFELSGTGIAPRLEFAYINEAGTIAVSENGTIILTSARVGESSRVEVSVQNTGTSAVTISRIEVVPANGIYTVEGSPALPLNLEPGSGLRFGMRFAPNNVGALPAVLRINNSDFNLSGTGRQPVPIPEYRVTGPTGVQSPLQQPAVGLTLASPYSLPLRGTLNLTFSSDVFTTNPAVQFASGGRSVAFTIPAGATQATFDNGSSEIRLQTGTVAGSIQVAPTFATTAGLDVTPTTATPLSMTVSREAPRLLTADISARGLNSLTLQVNGFTTTRTLRSVEVQIVPRDDAEFTTTVLRFNVESSTLAWFQTPPSEAFGGLFSLTIPLTFSRDSSTEDLIRYVQSLNVTATNEVGTSSSVGVAP
jgi:hypothetical protein